MNKIHISFADYDPKGTFSRHVAVAMASVLYNTTDPVCVHILHDKTLSFENKEKLEWTLKNCGNIHQFQLQHELVFHDLSDIYTNCKVNLQGLCKGFSIGTSFHLNLPNILPNIDKIIVFDSDTVTTLDIKELWDLPLGNYTLAAVRDMENHRIAGISNPIPYSHINSGVEVIDLAKVRAANSDETLFQHFVNYVTQYNPPFLDQEFMSAEFYGKILFIDPRFNTLKKQATEDLSKSKIWHFASLKPWKELTGSNAQLLYWKYLQKTAWSDELVDAFYLAATNGGHWHRHTRDCFMRMFVNVKRETKRGVAKLFGVKAFIE